MSRNNGNGNNLPRELAGGQAYTPLVRENVWTPPVVISLDAVREEGCGVHWRLTQHELLHELAAMGAQPSNNMHTEIGKDDAGREYLAVQRHGVRQRKAKLDVVR